MLKSALPCIPFGKKIKPLSHEAALALSLDQMVRDRLIWQTSHRVALHKLLDMPQSLKIDFVSGCQTKAELADYLQNWLDFTGGY